MAHKEYEIYNKDGIMQSTGLTADEVHHAFIMKNLDGKGFKIMEVEGSNQPMTFEEFLITNPMD